MAWRFNVFRAPRNSPDAKVWRLRLPRLPSILARQQINASVLAADETIGNPPAVPEDSGSLTVP